MSNISQKSERRKEQNRRAQANLRRKQQQRIENLQQQIQSLKATAGRAQPCTGEETGSQIVDYGNSEGNSDFYRSYSGSGLRAVTEDLSSYLIENSLLTQDLSVPAFDPFFPCVQQLPTPSYQASSTARSPDTTGPSRQAAERVQSAVSAIPQFHCAFDALSQNASLLGISPESFLSTNSNSIFYSPLLSLASISASFRHLPSEFQPTMAQLSYPHQPWIDCIPLRDLRSRIIFGVSHRPPFLDSLDIWHDVLSNGLSCAADPKDAHLWMMSNDFMQRWQMLLSIDLATLETMCLTSNPPVRKLSLPVC